MPTTISFLRAICGQPEMSVHISGEKRNDTFFFLGFKYHWSMFAYSCVCCLFLVISFLGGSVVGPKERRKSLAHNSHLSNNSVGKQTEEKYEMFAWESREIDPVTAMKRARQFPRRQSLSCQQKGTLFSYRDSGLD